MSNEKSGCSSILVIALFIGVGFVVWKYVLLSGTVFGYIGYNTYFLLDNLFFIRGSNPIVMYGIWGCLLGGLLGVSRAINKYKLSKWLILFPLAFLGVMITLFWLINKPNKYTIAASWTTFQSSVSNPFSDESSMDNANTQLQDNIANTGSENLNQSNPQEAKPNIKYSKPESTIGVITAKDFLALKSQPNIDAPRLGKINPYSEVTISRKTNICEVVEGKSNCWYEIKHNGKTGYVFGSYLKLINSNSKEDTQNSEGQYCGKSGGVDSEGVLITGDNVRVRSTPQIQPSNILFKLGKGDIALLQGVEIGSNGDNWFKVCINNYSGWISGQYAKEITINEASWKKYLFPEDDQTKIMKMKFISYEEGDYPHLIFKNVESGDEFDFMHLNYNNYDEVKLLIEDNKAAFGFRENRTFVNKLFLISARKKTVKSYDLDGNPTQIEDWCMTGLKSIPN